MLPLWDRALLRRIDIVEQLTCNCGAFVFHIDFGVIIRKLIHVKEIKGISIKKALSIPILSQQVQCNLLYGLDNGAPFQLHYPVNISMKKFRSGPICGLNHHVELYVCVNKIEIQVYKCMSSEFL